MRNQGCRKDFIKTKNHYEGSVPQTIEKIGLLLGTV